MNFSQIYTYLQGKQTSPETKSPAYEKWIDFTDDLEFLVRSSTTHIPIYISMGHFFLYSVLVPKQKLRGTTSIICSNGIYSQVQAGDMVMDMTQAQNELKKCSLLHFPIQVALS